MKNRFHSLTAELDDYRRECKNKNKRSEISRRFVHAKSTKNKNLVELILQEKREWNEKIFHGMSLFEGVRLLNKEDQEHINNKWAALDDYVSDPNPGGGHEKLIKHYYDVEIHWHGAQKSLFAILKQHKNKEIADLESKIIATQRVINSQIAQINKYQRAFEKFNEKAKPFNDLKDYASRLTQLARLGDKATKWATGRAGGAKVSLLSVNPKSIKAGIDNFANVYLDQVTQLFLRNDAKDILGSSYSSMGKITQEYIALLDSLEKNKDALDAYKAQLKMSTGQSSMMSAPVVSDNEFVLDILEFFFLERLHESQLNDALRELAAIVLWTAKEASKSLDMVPRPPMGVPSPKWLLKEAVKVAHRVIKNKGIYESVRKTVALKWKSAYEIAKINISPGKISGSKSYSSQEVAGQMNLSEIKSLVESVQFSNLPLDPVTGGMSIPVSTLRPGDIILSTTNSHISKAIRKMTSSVVSHSILYIGDSKVIEAVGSGVVMRSIDEALKDASLAVAFEHPNITDPKINQIIDYARSKIGKKYDKWGIVRQAGFQIDKKTICNRFSNAGMKTKCINWAGKINLGTSTNDEFFCSELILAAYQHAGIPLTTTLPHWNSPEDIAELRLSNKLKYVGHLISF